MFYHCFHVFMAASHCMLLLFVAVLYCCCCRGCRCVFVVRVVAVPVIVAFLSGRCSMCSLFCVCSVLLNVSGWFVNIVG